MVQIVKGLHKKELTNGNGEEDTTQGSDRGVTAGARLIFRIIRPLEEKEWKQEVILAIQGRDGGALAKSDSNRYIEKWRVWIYFEKTGTEFG